jgi:hypothetical protein
MRSPHPLAVTLVLLAACQSPTSDPALTFLAGTDSAAADRTPAAAEPINPINFPGGSRNRLFPLIPGTSFYYTGEDDGVPTTGLMTVTSSTKVIIGVTTIVVHDQVWNDGDLVEDTFDWYAEDRRGNVWYFGEDVTQLDHGQIIGHVGSWEAGVAGAIPGIIMPAAPQKGKTYQQELAVGVAEDQMKVVSLDATVRVPFGTLTGCLRTEEFTPLAPGVLDNKFHCPGVGLVRGVTVIGSPEIYSLTRITQP